MRYILLFLFLSSCAFTSSERDYGHEISEDSHPLVLTSVRYLGYDEHQNRRELRSMLGIDPVQTEWCAAFVNYILRKNDYPTSGDIHRHPLLARSFLDYGEDSRDDPQVGDIVVLSRGSSTWQGHVGFFLTEITRDGYLYYAIISGNDDNQVKIGLYPYTRVLAVRRVN